MNPRVEIAEGRLEELCMRHGIKRLALFGSVLGDDFNEDSDVDILVEFKPATRIGYMGLAGIENELTAVFGRKVDLRTPNELSRYFRQDILDSAETLYEAA